MTDTPLPPLSLTPDELALIESAARQFGQSPSEFIRDAATTTARQVCDYWHLSAAQRDNLDAFMPAI
jgi:uncharacterized protein (DUF1778 family)